MRVHATRGRPEGLLLEWGCCSSCDRRHGAVAVGRTALVPAAEGRSAMMRPAHPARSLPRVPILASLLLATALSLHPTPTSAATGIAVSGVTASASAAQRQQALASLSALPLGFVPNAGQATP